LWAVVRSLGKVNWGSHCLLSWLETLRTLMFFQPLL
jgi:hypothetical protein